jgi:PTH1 family peptidyl-tRNA hydrolase
MKIIFGLGNPGEKYLKTRHNIGFILLDLIATEFDAKFRNESKFSSEIAEINWGGEKIILCKPLTFMNNSGEAVSKITHYYDVKPRDILVIHDEIDLMFSDNPRFSLNSSSAGHRGVQSIIDHLGTQEFKRARYGIKHEKNKLPTEIFVLKNFSSEELEIIKKIDAKQIISALAV